MFGGEAGVPAARFDLGRLLKRIIAAGRKRGDTVQLSGEWRQELLQDLATLNAQGANLDCANYRGQTPLIVAARHGVLEVVKALLCYGANINKQTEVVPSQGYERASGGNTALMWAAYFGEKEVVRTLLLHAEQQGHLRMQLGLKDAEGKTVEEQVKERLQEIVKACREIPLNFKAIEGLLRVMKQKVVTEEAILVYLKQGVLTEDACASMHSGGRSERQGAIERVLEACGVRKTKESQGDGFRFTLSQGGGDDADKDADVSTTHEMPAANGASTKVVCFKPTYTDQDASLFLHEVAASADPILLESRFGVPSCSVGGTPMFFLCASVAASEAQAVAAQAASVAADAAKNAADEALASAQSAVVVRYKACVFLASMLDDTRFQLPEPEPEPEPGPGPSAASEGGASASVAGATVALGALRGEAVFQTLHAYLEADGKEHGHLPDVTAGSEALIDYVLERPMSGSTLMSKPGRLRPVFRAWFQALMQGRQEEAVALLDTMAQSAEAAFQSVSQSVMQSGRLRKPEKKRLLAMIMDMRPTAFTPLTSRELHAFQRWAASFRDGLEGCLFSNHNLRETVASSAFETFLQALGPGAKQYQEAQAVHEAGIGGALSVQKLTQKQREAATLRASSLYGGL